MSNEYKRPPCRECGADYVANHPRQDRCYACGRREWLIERGTKAGKVIDIRPLIKRRLKRRQTRDWLLEVFEDRVCEMLDEEDQT